LKFSLHLRANLTPDATAQGQNRKSSPGTSQVLKALSPPIKVLHAKEYTSGQGSATRAA